MLFPEIWCPRFGGLGFNVFVYGLNKSAKVVITWAWGFFLYLLYVTYLDNLKKKILMISTFFVCVYSAASLGMIADIFQLKYSESQFQHIHTMYTYTHTLEKSLRVLVWGLGLESPPSPNDLGKAFKSLNSYKDIGLPTWHKNWTFLKTEHILEQS